MERARLYSIIGMRLANERSGSTSLFAHPVALEPVPLEGSVPSAKDLLEARLEQALSELAQAAPKIHILETLSDHLSLFTRWFYRPAARASGEMIFAGVDGEVARKPLLRAISRIASRANSANPEELAKPPSNGTRNCGDKKNHGPAAHQGDEKRVLSGNRPLWKRPLPFVIPTGA